MWISRPGIAGGHGHARFPGEFTIETADALFRSVEIA
jgi:hypothetical protein